MNWIHLEAELPSLEKDVLLRIKRNNTSPIYTVGYLNSYTVRASRWDFEWVSNGEYGIIGVTHWAVIDDNIKD